MDTPKEDGGAANRCLRDYFAAAALTGQLASYASPKAPPADYAEIAKDAYIMADAMLRARKDSPNV